MSWYDSDNPTKVVRGASWRIGVWVIALLLFVGLISVTLWAFGVFTAPIKGKGDAFKQKESGTNRIIAQERFEDMYQNVIVADQRIDAMARAVELDPSTVNKANLNGSVNYCISAVGKYNAEARKYTAADFRATDLPAQITNVDPATDCKETEQR